MNKSVVTKYQPSITEWFAAIGEKKESSQFRKEDNYKVDRLEALYQEIGLDYERPEKFLARDLVKKTDKFAKILENRGNELCAIRLVPKKPSLTKIRKRGLSIKECYKSWFLKQNIDPENYIAYICPHTNKLLWSAIFVVSEKAVFGEIIRGGAAQLTHGNTKHGLVQFIYDFKNWQWSKNDKKAQEQVKKMIKMLKVTRYVQQNQLKNKLKAKFAHEYLQGYFETVVWPGNKIYFIDYNRLLPKYIKPPLSIKKSRGLVAGVAAFSGQTSGQVVVVNLDKSKKVSFPKGSVLVCDNTDVRYLPYIKKASAIITNRGGILSHAAIVSREFKKPCIVNTQNATRVLKNNDKVEVNADRGIIKRL